MGRISFSLAVYEGVCVETLPKTNVDEAVLASTNLFAAGMFYWTL